MSNFDHIDWKAESKTGVVAAGGAGAVAAGITILDQGGNAADAAASTILALNITDHGACSIGGEVPVLIWNGQEVKSLSGMGRAPRAQPAIDWYMQNGIPDKGIKMAPVPSVVDLCITMLQQYGTLSFETIIAPTLDLLDTGGEDWHPNLAETLRRLVEEEQRTHGNREQKLQAACDRFYGRDPERNDIAAELEAFYIENGGFLRREDLAAHQTLIEDPVVVNYKGYDVYKCGPWTQGPYLCQALRLLQSFDLNEMGYLSVDYIHTTIEAIKLATADRDAYYGDPLFVDVPMDALLSDEYTTLRQSLIDPAKASPDIRPGDPINMNALMTSGIYRPSIGGTTTCVVADKEGMVVSATPSANVYHAGGSGSTGVSYGNRLRSLNTTPGHPNCIAAGKRPRITLTPTLVLKDSKPVLAISVAGGDLQDQTALNLLLDHIEFGMTPADAVVAPRFSTSHHEDSFDPNPDRQATLKQALSLTINRDVDQDVRDALSQRGHYVRAVDGSIGTPVMLWIDGDTYYVAGDPSAKRHAAGL